MTSLSGSLEMYRKRDVTHLCFQSIIRSLYYLCLNLFLYYLNPRPQLIFCDIGSIQTTGAIHRL